MNSHIRQNFAVKTDARMGQSVDKSRIGRAFVAAGRADARNPQTAEIALFVAAVAVGIVAALANRFFGGLKTFFFCPK